MTITWEQPVSPVTWESATAPGITWTTVVGGEGASVPNSRLVPVGGTAGQYLAPGPVWEDLPAGGSPYHEVAAVGLSFDGEPMASGGLTLVDGPTFEPFDVADGDTVFLINIASGEGEVWVAHENDPWTPVDISSWVEGEFVQVARDDFLAVLRVIDLGQGPTLITVPTTQQLARRVLVGGTGGGRFTAASPGSFTTGLRICARVTITKEGGDFHEIKSRTGDNGVGQVDDYEGAIRLGGADFAPSGITEIPGVYYLYFANTAVGDTQEHAGILCTPLWGVQIGDTVDVMINVDFATETCTGYRAAPGGAVEWDGRLYDVLDTVTAAGFGSIIDRGEDMVVGAQMSGYLDYVKAWDGSTQFVDITHATMVQGATSFVDGVGVEWTSTAGTIDLVPGPANLAPIPVEAGGGDSHWSTNGSGGITPDDNVSLAGQTVYFNAEADPNHSIGASATLNGPEIRGYAEFGVYVGDTENDTATLVGRFHADGLEVEHGDGLTEVATTDDIDAIELNGAITGPKAANSINDSAFHTWLLAKLAEGANVDISVVEGDIQIAVTGLGSAAFAATSAFDAAGAAAAAQAAAIQRANHTGTQAISTITNLQTALDAKQPVVSWSTSALTPVAAYSSKAADIGENLFERNWSGTNITLNAGQTVVTKLRKRGTLERIIFYMVSATALSTDSVHFVCYNDNGGVPGTIDWQESMLISAVTLNANSYKTGLSRAIPENRWLAVHNGSSAGNMVFRSCSLSGVNDSPFTLPSGQSSGLQRASALGGSVSTPTSLVGVSLLDSGLMPSLTGRSAV